MMENSAFGEFTNDIKLISDIQSINANGATSDVYKAFVGGKWVFVKRPKKEFANHPQYLQAFEKEYEIGSALNHPNIVKYITKNADSDGLYILTEYVDGLTLKDFVDENPDYFKNKKKLNKFITQLLSALEYLHERQYLHLDLKPENILITRVGLDVKIIDLGFAYSDSRQYQTIGKSAKWAAPEQITNDVRLDQRADIYSFGILVLFAYTRTHNQKNIDRLPNVYRTCVKKCLENDRNNRFNSIESIKNYFLRKNKQKRIVIFSIILFVLFCSAGTLHFSISKITRIDISKIDAPKDIMEKINFTTSLDYVVSQFGEAKEIYSNSSSNIYNWYFKNLKMSITEMGNKELYPYSYHLGKDSTEMKRAEISFKLLGEADLSYDEILSYLNIPDFGKAKLGDVFDIYGYSNFTLYIDAWRYRADENSFVIFMEGNSLTNYLDYALISNVWFFNDLPQDIKDKLHNNEGNVSVLSKEEKLQLLEVVRKLKITSITCAADLRRTDISFLINHSLLSLD